MPDSLMYAIAVLLLLSAAAVMIYNGCRRRGPSHRLSLAAAAIALISSLLFALTHSYWYAGAVLEGAALFTGLGVGQYLASRRQPDEKSSPDAAPHQ